MYLCIQDTNIYTPVYIFCNTLQSPNNAFWGLWNLSVTKFFGIIEFRIESSSAPDLTTTAVHMMPYILHFLFCGL